MVLGDQEHQRDRRDLIACGRDEAGGAQRDERLVMQQAAPCAQRRRCECLRFFCFGLAGIGRSNGSAILKVAPLGGRTVTYGE
jgi:hypothetical protein